MLTFRFLNAAVGALAIVALALPNQPSPAPEIYCQADRKADGSYVGTCRQRDRSTAAQFVLQAPAANETSLWRGTAKFSWRDQEEPFAVDVGKRGAVRTGTQWFGIGAVESTPALLSFAFSRDRVAAPTAVDLRILRDARAYLSQPSRWNRLDDTDMNMAPTNGLSCNPTLARSLFCSLYQASVGIAREYWHGRPAMMAVRDAIAAAAKAPWRHPLIDFNNASTTSLTDVQTILDTAIGAVNRGLAQKVAPPPAAVAGTWQVVPGSPDAPMTLTPSSRGWLGKRASYETDLAVFDTHRCLAPEFAVRSVDAELYFIRDFHLEPKELGVERKVVTIVELQCGDDDWVAPGSLLVIKDRGHLLTVWSGVWYQLARAGKEGSPESLTPLG